MSKLTCRFCSNQMSNIMSDNVTEGLIVRNCPDVSEDSMNSDIRDLDIEPSLRLWECWHCGGLAIGDDPIKWYPTINDEFRILPSIKEIELQKEESSVK